MSPTQKHELNPLSSPKGRFTPVASGAKWSLLLLLAINLFNFIDRFVLASLVPEIKRQFGAQDWQMGALATAFMVSYMVAAPIFGWLADRYNRWVLIGIGVLVWSLASGASGYATGIGMMLATRLFVGIGEAAYGPAAPTILSDLYPVEKRGKILALFYVAIPIGSALGFSLGGATLHMGYSWRTAFLIVVPPGILLALASLFMRDPRRSLGNSPAALKKLSLSDYKAFARIPSYVFNTLGMTLATFALGGIAFWFPSYIVWRHELAGIVDPTNAQAVKDALSEANGIFGPVVVIAGLLGTIVGGVLGDWLRPRYSGSYFLVSGVSMILAFPLFVALPFTPFPAAWGVIFVACLCLFVNTGPANTVLANVTHPSIRAAGYALNILIIHALGDAISPTLIGVISDLCEGTGQVKGNLDAGFQAVGVTILLSGILWIWGAKHLARDTENVERQLAAEA